jgi:drug/metabolite transporter (DMT)-like permease
VPTGAVALILAGALCHALWNMLVRRGAYPEGFVWWLAAAAAVVYAPLGLYLLIVVGLPAAGLPFVGATVAIHVVYFILLGRAYQLGDLSIVYPIARGTGPLLVPFIAVPLLGERLSPLGVVGIALILVGVVTLQVGGLRAGALGRLVDGMRHPAARYAFAVGVTIAFYSVVDKAGVGRVDPLLYGYLIFVGAALAAGPYFWLRCRPAVLGSWRENRGSLLLAGLLSPLSYFMALTAFRLGQVSYLAPMREVSIVLAALLGALVLGEELSASRLGSAALTAAGVALIGLGA